MSSVPQQADRERADRASETRSPDKAAPTPVRVPGMSGDALPPVLPAQQAAWAMHAQRTLGNRATAALLGGAARGGSVRTRFAVEPHTTSPAALEAQRAIYSRGQTPVTDRHGRIEALDMRPADAQTAGRHLGEIRDRFGDSGLLRSVHGLGVTRGSVFAGVAVQHAPAMVRASAAPMLRGGSIIEQKPQGTLIGGRAGPAAAAAIQRSAPAGGLPPEVHAQLGVPLGGRGAEVRIHHDAAAHEAARLLDARAFTIGRSVYFGEGEYRPSTREGARLLAHEVAHTVQQADATVPAPGDLEVSSPSSAEEVEAERFAEAAMLRPGERGPEIRQRAPGVARLMRVISFTHANDTFTINHPESAETATTFQIAAGAPAAPHFQWDTDVTIHGAAGDPFGNFEVGPHQVVRSFWFDIFWGVGANQSHRTSHVTLPIRDTATTAADIWYATNLVSPTFGADGDVRSTNINDTPGATGQPFDNPVPPRASTTGSFQWGMAFVAFISARDTTAGGGAAAFRHIGHVYWNLSLAGAWDTARPVGSRIRRTDGGRTNHAGVINGPSTAFPTMHGGAIFNDQANANLTTT